MALEASAASLAGRLTGGFEVAANQRLAVLSAKYAHSAAAPLMKLQRIVKDCCHLDKPGADPKAHLGLQACQALLMPAAATVKEAGSPASYPGD